MSQFICVLKQTESFRLLHPQPPVLSVSVASLSEYKISLCGCINIHPGSSISSQFWLRLSFLQLGPQNLCGLGLRSLAEKTLWEGICGLETLF